MPDKVVPLKAIGSGSLTILRLTGLVVVRGLFLQSKSFMYAIDQYIKQARNKNAAWVNTPPIIKQTKTGDGNQTALAKVHNFVSHAFHNFPSTY